eukprot:TRINITY_DN7820_c0_g1_i1.p1 TRINITY_DN7820_c0_g1~~TRINITY_DN7820_c0_g1_i1.p1  ORF type:complete len:160 (-),score=38.54 TRINITY_DN7820_c0_g1_i1:206-685(-)
MAGIVERRLSKIGLTLPKASAPAANYVPWRRSGNIVFIAGQIPRDGDKLLIGRLGEANYSLDEGKAAARLCGVHLVAQMKDACGGDLNKVKQVLKVEAFVNCTDDFKEHPQVVNGCSDLLADVFGKDVGAHSRFAVGSNSLPFGVSVEIGAMVELHDSE